jgi:hypothetical protein
MVKDNCRCGAAWRFIGRLGAQVISFAPACACLCRHGRQAAGDAAGRMIPGTHKFFTRFHFRRGTVIHRWLRGASRSSPRQRLNNSGNRIRDERESHLNNDD